MDEENPLWCQVVRSIHSRDSYNWHTAGKNGNNLRSPWISVSRNWLKVGDLATFKLGYGFRIAFWLEFGSVE